MYPKYGEGLGNQVPDMSSNFGKNAWGSSKSSESSILEKLFGKKKE